jgi:Fe-S-cluster containining protein
MNVSYEVWLLSLIPCPLLDENKRCTVYTERPLTCRTMISVGDPYYCHPHNMGDQTEVIPREGVIDKLREVERKVSRDHRLQIGPIPLGQALLLAEKVCNGDIEMSAVDLEIMKEFTLNG